MEDMSYRIEKFEDLEEEITRIAREQVGKAIEEFRDTEMERHEAVHQARKRFKKIRGLLRLVRGELGGRYSDENKFYRDLGRKLSYVRDAQAMIETFDMLAEKYPGEFSSDPFVLLRERLEKRLDDVARNEVGLNTIIDEVVQSLEHGRERIAEWSLSREGFKNIKPGLRKVYKRGCEGLYRSLDSLTVENLHDWRKRVKYLWYHSRLLREIWPEMMNIYIDEAKKLTDYLGDDHDLSVFLELLEEDESLISEKEAKRTLENIIDREQSTLRTRAIFLGRFIYAEKPRYYTRRIKTYWQARIKAAGDSSRAITAASVDVSL